MKRSTIVVFQSAYYFLTGLWPVVDIASFMQVTGEKQDIWLVKMVGLLTVAIALALFSGYKNPGRNVVVLSVCAAFAYMLVDIYYYMTGIIAAIYMADAALEAAIISLILFSRPPQKSRE